MTSPDINPPKPTPLSLPASALNAPTALPHHDSEQFLRGDRHRTAQELEDICYDRPWSTRDSSLRSLSRRPSQTSTATDTSGPRTHRRLHLRRQAPRWYDGIVGFWTKNVSVAIEEGSHRDHLALERTFLGYLRTSLALAMTGVITAQLFRLQHSVSPDPRIGYYVLGVPLAASFISLGMLVLMIGALRFWRQQSAMVRGKVYAGGWEIAVIMASSLAITAVTFAMLVWVDVNKG
ncbi:uncharacterized protein N0V89_011558 [Didymosphaeria variabile]|uniref:DUF202 domain-containing protein n=1 Tax=Didymosphaeria variabile TaxID=1932322 RepID=A0A9W8XAS6_9PLEO|nr:uncharacterized protein N0V89_011558 [Didymosphaeria variabile]KAJ4345428.1 hypothetical protein N0V89_011558 [Didymosphaeria variabile]